MVLNHGLRGRVDQLHAAPLTQRFNGMHRATLARLAELDGGVRVGRVRTQSRNWRTWARGGESELIGTQFSRLGFGCERGAVSVRARRLAAQVEALALEPWNCLSWSIEVRYFMPVLRVKTAVVVRFTRIMCRCGGYSAPFWSQRAGAGDASG